MKACSALLAHAIEAGVDAARWVNRLSDLAETKLTDLYLQRIGRGPCPECGLPQDVLDFEHSGICPCRHCVHTKGNWR